MNQVSIIADPIKLLDRALAGAVRIYDEVKNDNPKLRGEVLLLIAHIRAARREAE